MATAAATMSSDNRKYVPSYKAGVWSGDVQAFHLRCRRGRGQAGVERGFCAPRCGGERKIYTWDADLRRAHRRSLSNGHRSATMSRNAWAPSPRRTWSTTFAATAARKRAAMPGPAVPACPIASASRLWVTS